MIVFNKYFFFFLKYFCYSLFFIRLTDLIELPVATKSDYSLDFTTYVSKLGATTGYTMGILVEDELTIRIRSEFEGAFSIFKGCFGVEDSDTPFFKPGDSGSGVFINDKENGTLKPLGIAFAKCGSMTVVSKISAIAEVFNISVYGDQNSELFEINTSFVKEGHSGSGTSVSRKETEPKILPA